MAAVSKAFHEVQCRRGLAIGIVPSKAGSVSPKAGYPNQWVELAISTQLPLSGAHGTQPLSRSHINILTSDVIVALQGSTGTASEVLLALSYQRPIVGFLDSRDEIPGISDKLPIHAEFEEVRNFVETCLAARDL